MPKSASITKGNEINEKMHACNYNGETASFMISNEWDVETCLAHVTYSKLSQYC